MTNLKYQLLDSGNGRKLEQFGRYALSRPCAQAVWKTQLPEEAWKRADSFFTREPDLKWTFKQQLPSNWEIDVSDIRFKISLTDFGHLGVFPEQAAFWKWTQNTLRTVKSQGRNSIELLNLFAYSGGVTLSAAKGGANVCHLDASKGMVDWARENAELNKLTEAPIRWIVDDAQKFLARELKRGRRYDAIVLDPPSFGRGAKGEIFKIEDDLLPLLEACAQLLSANPLFLMLSCHTPGYTPLVLEQVLGQVLHSYKGEIETGEMVIQGNEGHFSIPSGSFALWKSRELVNILSK